MRRIQPFFDNKDAIKKIAYAVYDTQSEQYVCEFTKSIVWTTKVVSIVFDTREQAESAAYICNRMYKDLPFDAQEGCVVHELTINIKRTDNSDKNNSYEKYCSVVEPILVKYHNYLTRKSIPELSALFKLLKSPEYVSHKYILFIHALKTDASELKKIISTYMNMQNHKRLGTYKNSVLYGIFINDKITIPILKLLADKDIKLELFDIKTNTFVKCEI